MSNLQKIENGGLPALTSYEKQICGCLNTFNQLRAFKLSVYEVMEWKDTIVRLQPNLEPARLEFAILALISEEIPYNKDLGIQNIIRALKQVGEDEKGYIIHKALY